MADEIEGVKPQEPVTDSQITEAKGEEEDNSKLLEALRKERERNKELAKRRSWLTSWKPKKPRAKRLNFPRWKS